MRRGLQATGWKETRGLVFFLDSWQRPDPLKGIMVALSLGQQGDGRAAQNQASGPRTGAGAWTVTAPSQVPAGTPQVPWAALPCSLFFLSPSLYFKCLMN